MQPNLSRRQLRRAIFGRLCKDARTSMWPVACISPSRLYSHHRHEYPPPPPPDHFSDPSTRYSYNRSRYEDEDYYRRSKAEAPLLNPTDLGTQAKPLVVVSADRSSSWLNRILFGAFILLSLNCALSIYDSLVSRMQDGSSMSIVGKNSGFSMTSSVHPVDLNDLEVTFESIRGCDEAKKELEEIVEFLKDPEKFRRLGGRLPKGALLVGPPGCGKTLLAKAIAKEAGVTFFYATGSEFDEMFVGVGSRRVRELFAAAKEAAPALIFIDEIDALGGRRSQVDHAHSRMTLNQLLAEMDGFQSNESIFVLAATNTPETLDKALTRPGRLDTTISVDPPDMKGRAEVLQVYLDKVQRDDTVNAMDIARGTTGFTGAELSNLVNLAAIRAAVLGKSKVSKDEIEYAKDRVTMGTESTKIIPEEERRVTAYHEGGHALSAILLRDEGADPVHKATIVPRGSGVMGLVLQLPERDKYSQSKRQCLSRLKVCVAGRVGEEILLGPHDITSGAGSDFQQATNMARNMVRRFGFSDSLGFVDYGSADTAEGAYMSDETKQKIEVEVHNLVQQAYLETKEMLVKHRSQLDAIAAHLLTHETLTGEDIQKILRGEKLPARPPKPLPVQSKSVVADVKKQRTVPIS